MWFVSMGAVIENLINLNISTSYFLVTHIVVLLAFIDWKYTGKLDKIFSRDFEIWILILLKIYITQKNKMAEFKMADIIGKNNLDYICACACLLLLSMEAFPFNELVQCPGGSSATDSVVPQKWLSKEMTLGLLHGGGGCDGVGGLAPGELQILNLGGSVSEVFLFVQMVGTNLGKCE